MPQRHWHCTLGGASAIFYLLGLTYTIRMCPLWPSNMPHSPGEVSSRRSIVSVKALDEWSGHSTSHTMHSVHTNNTRVRRCVTYVLQLYQPRHPVQAFLRHPPLRQHLHCHCQAACFLLHQHCQVHQAACWFECLVHHSTLLIGSTQDTTRKYLSKWDRTSFCFAFGARSLKL